MNLEPFKENGEESHKDYLIKSFTNLAYFKERLSTASERGRKSILSAFGLNESPEGFEFLKNVVSEDNSELKHDAIRAMAPLVFGQNREARDYIQKIARDSNDSQLVSTAVTVLGWSKKAELSPTYISLLESDDDRVRANATEALIPINFADKTKVFRKLLTDSAPRVCSNSLLGLWLDDDEGTLECLYGLLKSDDSKMRASGAYAVYFMSASRRFRRLFPAYRENSSLATIPIVENIIKRLEMILESSEPSERFQALRAIGKIGDSSSKKAVENLLEYETEPEIFSLANNIINEWANYERES